MALRSVATTLVTLLFACSVERHEPEAAGLTWKGDIQPLFSADCATCHSGDSPGGGYDVTTYLGVLGNG